MILVTGSEGLIGRAFCKLLEKNGVVFRRFDQKLGNDIRAGEPFRDAIAEVDGIVHLAALTRVKRCEQQWELCRDTNLIAVIGLVGYCYNTDKWIVFASSREVYGQQNKFPVTEDAEHWPKNRYAKSKAVGEALMKGEHGPLANIIRFSSVYGDVDDHPDRLVPAFAKAAANDGAIIMEGVNTTLDLVHVEDAADGLWRMVERTMAGIRLPPIHLVSGTGATVMELAERARRESKTLKIVAQDPRPYHVDKFVGDPERALKLLDWRATTTLEAGFARLVEDFRKVRDEPESKRL